MAQANGGNGEAGEMLATLKAILDVQRGQADMLRALREETHAGLSDLRTELQAVNQVLHGHGRQLEAIHGTLREHGDRLDKLEVTTEEGFSDLRTRFDNLLERASERDREQGRRLDALAERVARLEGRTPEGR